MPQHARTVACRTLLFALAGCREAVAPPGAAGTETAPATLSLSDGQRSLGLMLGAWLRLPLVVRDARGVTLPLPAGLSVVSRDPAVASVDSGAAVTGRALGETWVVATLSAEGRVLADSLRVTVLCTLELRMEVTPGAPRLAVGESVTPAVRLSSCDGRLQLTDTLRWAAQDTAVVQVDSLSGRTTGRRPGQTFVAARGSRYASVGGMLVTVVAAAP